MSEENKVVIDEAKKNRRAHIRKRAKPESKKEEEEEEDETEIGQRNKQTKREGEEGKKEGESLMFAIEGDKILQTHGDQGATRLLETETEHAIDARSRREKILKKDDSKEEKGPTKYKGMTGYTDYTKGFKKELTVSREKATGAHGPLRGNNYIRTSVRFDYQPDVCKDYKETGFCSYGDSCKFLHDRGDYKAGWELEKEWEEEQRKNMEKLKKIADRVAEGKYEDDESDEEIDDGLPFACCICKITWHKESSPVVTLCKHYFCEKCALKHNLKSRRCYVCDASTKGIFNVANEIVNKLKTKK